MLVIMAGHFDFPKLIFQCLLTGTSLSVIINLDRNISIIVSAAVALLYTCFGKMVSVAYTDVFQLLLVTFGMVSSQSHVNGR